MQATNRAQFAFNVRGNLFDLNGATGNPLPVPDQQGVFWITEVSGMTPRKNVPVTHVFGSQHLVVATN
jgi:hypothetical protein